MFGKDNSQLSSYQNQNAAGTNFLRNTIRAKLYSGDSIIEEKLTQSQLYWKFYNNRHWADNNDELLSFNYVRAVIDKVNNFLLGKEGFEMTITDSYGDTIPEELSKVYEALLRYNWKKNKKKTLVTKMLQMGGITGDVYIFLSPDEETGYIKYTLLDSRIVVPKFTDGDYTKIESYRVVTSLLSNEKKYIRKVQEYTKDKVLTYFNKDTGDDAEKFELETFEFSYGFIPIVHIENIPMSDSYGGKSDMDDILKLNKVLNEMSEDVKTIVDYYAAPTTVITGGTVGMLKRGINQIWSGLPSDANVFNLSLGEDLSASMNFLKLLKDSIHDLSGVPEEVLSKVQHISNTSAAALQMLYQPIIQVADKKALSYGEGIEEINRMTMLLFAKFLPNHPLYKKLPNKSTEPTDLVRYYDRYRAETVWKYNLPSDRMGMLTEAQIELQQGLGSRKEIMERLGKVNVPKLLAEIEEDTKRIVEIEQQKAPAPPAEVKPPVMR